MKNFLFAAILVLSLAGCGRVPEPVGYNYSVQPKMQAVHHWDVLATDLASQINNQLVRNGFVERPVFVQETCGNDSRPCQPNQTSTFSESFRDLLISRLVAFGVPTVSAPGKDSITVNYKAQLIYHPDPGVRTIQPGLLTTIGAGIVVLRNAAESPLIFVGGLLLDLANASLTGKSDYEVMITTSLTEKNAYIFRQTDIYYINDADFWHYQDNLSAAEPIILSSTYMPATEEEPDSLTLTSEQPEPATVIEPAPSIVPDTPDAEKEIPQHTDM